MAEQQANTATMELYDYSDNSVRIIVGHEAIQSYIKTRLTEASKPPVHELIEIDRNLDKLAQQGIDPIDHDTQDLLNQALDKARTPYRRLKSPE